MRLVEIDVMSLEAPERALDRCQNMSLRKALLTAHLHTHLGRNDDACAISAAFHPVSDYGFGFATLMPWDPCRIYVGGIDEIKSRPNKGVEQLNRSFLVDRPAEDVPAEAKWVDFQARNGRAYAVPSGRSLIV